MVGVVVVVPHQSCIRKRTFQPFLLRYSSFNSSFFVVGRSISPFSPRVATITTSSSSPSSLAIDSSSSHSGMHILTPSQVRMFAFTHCGNFLDLVLSYSPQVVVVAALLLLLLRCCGGWHVMVMVNGQASHITRETRDNRQPKREFPPCYHTEYLFLHFFDRYLAYTWKVARYSYRL